jgi:hypothetical protein
LGLSVAEREGALSAPRPSVIRPQTRNDPRHVKAEVLPLLISPSTSPAGMGLRRFRRLRFRPRIAGQISQPRQFGKRLFVGRRPVREARCCTGGAGAGGQRGPADLLSALAPVLLGSSCSRPGHRPVARATTTLFGSSWASPPTRPPRRWPGATVWLPPPCAAGCRAVPWPGLPG